MTTRPSAVAGRSVTERARATRKPAALRRQEILAAAAVEFAETGFAGTRLEDIAARAGISHPRVVQMFGSKLELFLRVVERAFDQIEHEFRESASGANASLVTLGDAYLRLLQRERSVGLVMLQAYAAAAENAVRNLVTQRYLRVQRVIAELTGADANQVLAFIGTGLVVTVAAVLQLPGRRKDAVWAAWLLERVVEP